MIKAASLGVTLIAASTFVASSADALCVYSGKLYAKTTLAQEFKDSKLVVIARVASDRSLWSLGSDGGWASADRLDVEHVYKGGAVNHVAYFTWRDSGGFYLDRGKRYLLFLNRVTEPGVVRRVPGAWTVNYSCGQSAEWSTTTADTRRQLGQLSH